MVEGPFVVSNDFATKIVGCILFSKKTSELLGAVVSVSLRVVRVRFMHVSFSLCPSFSQPIPSLLISNLSPFHVRISSVSIYDQYAASIRASTHTPSP